MLWIYLSPHLDDAVFSCGGFIWEQTRQGTPAAVWTLFAGNPRLASFSPFASTLHHRWQAGPDAAAVRREEDRLACVIVGAQPRTFDYPDCIYRSLPDTGDWVIRREEDLFSPAHPAETHLLDGWVEMAVRSLPTNASLVAPLGLGGHVDHRLTRQAAGQLVTARPDLDLLFYADLPYVLQGASVVHGPASTVGESLEPVKESISEQGLQAWQSAAAAYRSQISSFWTGPEAMASDLRRYWENGGGRLFRVNFLQSQNRFGESRTDTLDQPTNP